LKSSQSIPALTTSLSSIDTTEIIVTDTNDSDNTSISSISESESDSLTTTTTSSSVTSGTSTSTSSSTSGMSNCVMFNIKILLLCIFISYLNESSILVPLKLKPQQVQDSPLLFLSQSPSSQVQVQSQPFCFDSPLFQYQQYKQENYGQVSSFIVNSSSRSSSINSDQAEVEVDTPPRKPLNMEDANTNNGSDVPTNPLNNHGILYPFTTFLDVVADIFDGDSSSSSSTSSSTSSSLQLPLSLQQHFQLFYKNNIKVNSGASHYDVTKSTEDNYKMKPNTSTSSSTSTSTSTSHEHKFYGQYKQIRSGLDYSYHSNYIPSRQLLQDEIIHYILTKNNCCHFRTTTKEEEELTSSSAVASNPSSKSSNGSNTQKEGQNQPSKQSPPWIIFTAGAMGAGKSYTIKQLHSKNRFPLHKFITIDPDEIRHLLPEYQYYIKQTSNSTMMEYAGVYTKKESGYISEILVQIALMNGCNVLMDGSLRDYKWYIQHFESLRNQFNYQSHSTTESSSTSSTTTSSATATTKSGIQIGILHIKAPKEAIIERARIRSKITKRIVPIHVLEESIEMVPKSVKILSTYVDFFVDLYNGPNTPDIEIVSESSSGTGMTWNQFRSVFYDQEEMLMMMQTKMMVEDNINDKTKERIMSYGDKTVSTHNETKVALLPSEDESERSDTTSTTTTIAAETSTASSPPSTSKSSSSIINPGLKVDKELDYQLLRLLSKL
jgi:hypothetical protein